MVSYVAFAFSLFDLHVPSLLCLGRPMLRDCGILWQFSLVSVSFTVTGKESLSLPYIVREYVIPYDNIPIKVRLIRLLYRLQ